MKDQAPAQTGMITIEVVENPSFFDYAEEYLYGGLIVLFLALFIWRKLSLRKK